MERMEKVLDGLAHCLPETKEEAMNGCKSCSYFGECVSRYMPISLPKELVKDIRTLLKEQEERIKTLEHQLETITKWRANAGAFD